MSNTVLERLRSAHHKPARLFASGLSVSEIAKCLNLSEASVADLENDPAFIGLVQHYKDKENGKGS
jgi:hypothetical protein